MRVKTGVLGLDELVGGGLPRGSCTLLSGKCGTGKTIMSMQYIYRGITEYGEPGVFVSFESEPEDLCEDMRAFGWHLKVLENQGNLELMGGPIDRITKFGRRVGASGEDMIAEIIGVAREKGAERLALDGLAQLSAMFPDALAFRSGLARLRRELNKLGCTSVLTSEIEEGKDGLSRLGVEEYVADGVVVLYYDGDGLTRTRALEVRKMRGTEHSDHLSFFEISGEGVRITKFEETGQPKMTRKAPGKRGP
jgi:KaiC/GvpD/RAD55 family RecA-like ATPase